MEYAITSLILLACIVHLIREASPSMPTEIGPAPLPRLLAPVHEHEAEMARLRAMNQANEYILNRGRPLREVHGDAELAG